MKTGRAKNSPCNCVLRAIFRACFARFRYCADKDKSAGRISLEANPGRQRKTIWSRKDEEYVADFCLVTKRTLSEFEHRLFRYHFLLGADWKICCRRLNIDRGNFFHSVYRIEQKLGRAFRELEPYALFPLDEYFGSSMVDVGPYAIPLANMWGAPLRPPLRPTPPQQNEHVPELLQVA